MRAVVFILYFVLSPLAWAAPGTVIISGGTKGIGYELVKRLYEQGWKVATFARSNEDIESLKKEFSDPRRFYAAPLSITDYGAARQFVLDAERHLGPASHLVNNAGTTGPLKRIGEMTSDEIFETVGVNLVGAMNLTAAVVGRIQLHGAHGGVVVNISSGSARGVGGLTPYSAAKAGLNAATAAAAQDHPGTYFFSLNPGHVDTRLQTGVRTADPAVFPSAPDFKGYHERGELVTPLESATHIEYLLNNADKFPNGTVIDYKTVIERIAGVRCIDSYSKLKKQLPVGSN